MWTGHTNCQAPAPRLRCALRVPSNLVRKNTYAPISAWLTPRSRSCRGRARHRARSHRPRRASLGRRAPCGRRERLGMMVRALVDQRGARHQSECGDEVLELEAAVELSVSGDPDQPLLAGHGVRLEERVCLAATRGVPGRGQAAAAIDAERATRERSGGGSVGGVMTLPLITPSWGDHGNLTRKCARLGA